MPSGIYVWKLNGIPKYVGKGVDVHQRMNSKHTDSKALNNAIKKYGFDSFEKEIICYCEVHQLNEIERHYIRVLHTHRSENGYNLTWGGDGVGSGEEHPLFGVTGEKHPSWGRKASAQQKKILSESHIGVTHTEEVKKKMSISKMGERNPLFGMKLENATSQYFGVSKSVRNSKNIYWKAIIMINGKLKHIGYFKTEIEAAQAYNDYVVKLNLPYPLNNI
ncbi:MAG: GIY-YIG nuclease family protein [Anaerolineales bacterium]|nr:GIY-YIG nuclease family protein [Anaerolineales bacterium]MBX3038418.1 GIY-YIG nuclease family protein [Anaerolineales bacterium]